MWCVAIPLMVVPLLAVAAAAATLPCLLLDLPLVEGCTRCGRWGGDILYGTLECALVALGAVSVKA